MVQNGMPKADYLVPESQVAAMRPLLRSWQAKRVGEYLSDKVKSVRMESPVESTEAAPPARSGWGFDLAEAESDRLSPSVLRDLGLYPGQAEKSTVVEG